MKPWIRITARLITTSAVAAVALEGLRIGIVAHGRPVVLESLPMPEYTRRRRCEEPDGGWRYLEGARISGHCAVVTITD